MNDASFYARGAAAIALAALLALAGCATTPDSEQAHMEKVAAEHAGDKPVPALAGDLKADALIAPDTVFDQEVDYGSLRGIDANGYIAWPANADGPVPGVIVIHEWWGLNDNIREMAKRLAGEGYVALAVDLYGGEVAETAEGARALIGEAMQNVDGMRQNLAAANDFLRTRALSPAVGTVGWCFGGARSLDAALTLGGGIDAAVMYYGRPVLDESRLLALQSPLLGLFAGEDRSIPTPQVEQFREALASLNRDADIHIYPGTQHAFANPSGTRYDADAAADAWAKTLAFFETHLRPASASSAE